MKIGILSDVIFHFQETDPVSWNLNDQFMIPTVKPVYLSLPKLDISQCDHRAPVDEMSKHVAKLCDLNLSKCYNNVDSKKTHLEKLDFSKCQQNSIFEKVTSLICDNQVDATSLKQLKKLDLKVYLKDPLAMANNKDFNIPIVDISALTNLTPLSKLVLTNESLKGVSENEKTKEK